MEWLSRKEDIERLKDLVDVLFAVEERIYEISRGHLFRKTIIDFGDISEWRW